MSQPALASLRIPFAKSAFPRLAVWNASFAPGATSCIICIIARPSSVPAMHSGPVRSASTLILLRDGKLPDRTSSLACFKQSNEFDKTPIVIPVPFTLCFETALSTYIAKTPSLITRACCVIGVAARIEAICGIAASSSNLSTGEYIEHMRS